MLCFASGHFYPKSNSAFVFFGLVIHWHALCIPPGRQSNMLYFCLKTFLRNFKKYKTYSVINIMGLSVGIALFVLIMLFVQNEYGYDRFNEKLERIYRIWLGTGCVMPTGIAHFLDGQIPEIEKIVRFYPSYGKEYSVKYGENYLEIPSFVFADSSVFSR